jgi:hypothetical protein
MITRMTGIATRTHWSDQTGSEQASSGRAYKNAGQRSEKSPALDLLVRPYYQMPLA